MASCHRVTISILLSLLQTAFSASYCRDGWIQYDKSCYLFEAKDASWSEAMTHCKLYGAVLAEVDDYYENVFLLSEVRSLADPKEYWIGGLDSEIDGIWKWATSDRRFTFTDWLPGEPNDLDNEDCLEIMNNHWNDEDCYNRQNFICEYKLSGGSLIIG